MFENTFNFSIGLIICLTTFLSLFSLSQVNEYEGTCGIASHFEDTSAFGPIIATISLISPTLMSLTKPKVKDNDCEDLSDFTKILLEPCSLFVMEEECRFDWRHGISRTAELVPLPDGKFIRRDENYRRISLTIRHLKEGRRRVEDGLSVK